MAFAPRVLAVLGVGLLLMGARFTAFTYLTPFLTQVTGISGAMVSVFLLIFGAAAAAGTMVGGRAADRSATTTILVSNVALVAVLAALFAARETPLLVAVLLAAWGVAVFGFVPALELRLITLAGPGGDLAATLGASAVNAGIAAGSLIGGWALAGHGVAAPSVVALILTALAVPASWALRLGAPPASVVGDQPATRESAERIGTGDSNLVTPSATTSER